MYISNERIAEMMRNEYSQLRLGDIAKTMVMMRIVRDEYELMLSKDNSPTEEEE